MNLCSKKVLQVLLSSLCIKWASSQDKEKKKKKLAASVFFLFNQLFTHFANILSVEHEALAFYFVLFSCANSAKCENSWLKLLSSLMTLLSIKCFFLLLHVLFCQERDKRVFFKAYLTNFDPIKILLIFFSNKDRNKTNDIRLTLFIFFY